MKRFALATVAAVVAMAGPALAQDKPVEIKLAHWVPANHLLASTGFIPWGKSIEAASGGSIKVTIFPAQQLGKAADHYDMARDGIATVAYVNPGYQAGRFPIIAAGELPFLVDKPGPASQALDGLVPPVRRARDEGRQGLPDARARRHDPLQGPDHRPGADQGMKIRPANGTVGQMSRRSAAPACRCRRRRRAMRSRRAWPTRSPFPWNSIISFGIDKVTKFHTDMRLYAAVFVWAMNKPFYDGLSANQKKVIDNHCNNEWAAKVGAAWGDAEDAGREKLIAMGGHTMVPMSKVQIDAWKKAVAPVYDDWVAGAGKAGIDGKKALDDLRGQLARTGGAY